MTVQLEDVTVHFGRTCALEGLNLTVAAGETVALLGPSGSGKSTALKAVAGFVRPSRGRIRIAGVDVTDVPPAKRGIGVVVQQYALFPHLRVADNVAFGLRAARRPKAEVTRRVAEMLDMVGMSTYARRFPRELSGGQQQRVAIARALAIRPPVLLLDDPLAALDAQLRADMLDELQKLRREVPDVAIVYVTHDQAEALALADRIAVMRAARLVDIAPSADLYAAPPSAFTASFLGGANLLPVEVSADEVRVAGHPLAGVRAKEGNNLLCIRPHAVRLGSGGLPARLLAAQWRGASSRLTCAIDGLPDVRVHIDVPAGGPLPEVGAQVSMVLPPEACSLVPAGTR
ncbi:2-aminoethylphosphonate transport system ATP-binding protein [Kribbella sp. VKM Ac-2527]|uniref:ABC-type quaternary amine transporter n=1 Tax=Kribbella caucasensis TaxID=2512215 RepID=A0A4R6K6E5_9ACTN|nr:ABC transporter ATP-binding protein [Kribbella sp. VKM Ac-2527]TDO44996.1 2-aminoethylphosphonate transport system ATP-binding protein [Kribbella sp. VKM Ac-2527]